MGCSASLTKLQYGENENLDLLLFCPRSRLPHYPVKGILPQTIFYRPNLIFWIVMGCGKARFGRKGLKTTET